MANRQTRSLRKRGLSLRFNKRVDFSKERKGSTVSQTNPEFSIITMESMNPRRSRTTKLVPTLSQRDQTILFYEGLEGLAASKKRAA